MDIQSQATLVALAYVVALVAVVALMAMVALKALVNLEISRNFIGPTCQVYNSLISKNLKN